MSVSIAFIPLYPKAKFSSEGIKSDFEKKWSELPSLDPAKTEDDMIAFRIGSSDVIITFIHAPIPWSDLEEPCNSSWLWKKAESVLRNHTNFLIVTVLSQDEPVERCRLLTQICTSILATCEEAPGIFWTNAALLIASNVFQDFAINILPKTPPLYIWVDFRVGMSENGKTSGFTTGMKALGHMEFETESSTEPPGELKERFFALANYVLENGSIIKDGDTIGEDANERIRVVHTKSAFSNEGMVMRLEYSSIE